MTKNSKTKTVVIFASGAGTNAEAIIKHFSHSPNINIALIVSNKPDAKVLDRAKKFKIDSAVFNRHDFYDSDHVLKILDNINPDLIVLAGFLWKIPESIITSFPRQIVNIHPALLPNYGGKGMYGDNVHKAVLKNNEKETGITIHYVDENYDEGQIIAQFKTVITPKETLESLLPKIHQLEHKHYPEVIANILNAK